MRSLVGAVATLAVALVVSVCPAGEAPAPATISKVERVIDGDTIELSTGRRLRYIGIDAPEVRTRRGGAWVYDPQPFAVAATAENRRLVDGRVVRIEFDRERTDRYGRLLAYVSVDGILVNERLVRLGLARARSHPPNVRHDRRLRQAQDEARRRGIGLWSGEGK